MMMVVSSVREFVRSVQREMLDISDLMPDRAAELLMQLSALLGNCNDEIRMADAEYATVLLKCFETETKANRARIVAETTPAFRRKQEARDTKEVMVELIRSLKCYLRAKAEEYQAARHQ